MKRLVVIITDCSDIAYSEIRATILNAVEDLNIQIEPVVSVKPFSIINGNFCLRLMAENYPPETIFSVILNPLQQRPERLIGKTANGDFTFMGANTGVFDWFFRDFGISELYEYYDPGFLPFGGKYVHAPAIAKIAQGKELSKLGKVFSPEKVKRLDIPDGTIVHVDNFGLMKFTGSLIGLNEGQIVPLKINEYEIGAVFTERMMNYPDSTWVIYPGSSFGLPELGLVRKNGAVALSAKEGDVISLV
jgi:S-adenosylmethionine hydrolase